MGVIISENNIQEKEITNRITKYIENLALLYLILKDGHVESIKFLFSGFPKMKQIGNLYEYFKDSSYVWIRNLESNIQNKIKI